MDATLGRQANALSLFARLAEAPYDYDFYQTLRRLECLYAEKPRWGRALRPLDEPVRLGQEPDLSFAPAPLASFEMGRDGRPPRLQVRLFGLLGPNGPLPLHLTEYARERLRHAGDPTFSRFLDLFHHRFLALFYRAWAQAQPHVQRDRPDEDRFAAFVGAFAGVSPAPFRNRDAVPDLAKLFHVGALVRQVRNAEGLGAILQHFFRVPVRIEEFVGHWMSLGAGERTRLGADGATLGTGAVVGRAVWDRQHKFRIHLGPLALAQYESFLPDKGGPVSPKPQRGEGGPLRQLVDWVRMYLCFELDWDVRLCLDKHEVPPLKLGGRGQLGWTTWLGQRRTETDADELCLDAESVVNRSRP
ncbi:MAG: type VI secretion system baseplate subunit TssG [Luteitalea sp.]|nr:type VI secretion system baseplate subunit TssG [Luteitalea sp.]